MRESGSEACGKVVVKHAGKWQDHDSLKTSRNHDPSPAWARGRLRRALAKRIEQRHAPAEVSVVRRDAANGTRRWGGAHGPHPHAVGKGFFALPPDLDARREEVPFHRGGQRRARARDRGADESSSRDGLSGELATFRCPEPPSWGRDNGRPRLRPREPRIRAEPDLRG